MGVLVPLGDHMQTMGTVATTQGDWVGILIDKPPQHNTRGVIVGGKGGTKEHGSDKRSGTVVKSMGLDN